MFFDRVTLRVLEDERENLQKEQMNSKVRRKSKEKGNKR